jgi:iron complex transport system substrate-binding protein
MRIATLVPSATDLVCALGLAEQLVGVSHECDHPAARDLPVVTRSGLPSAPETDPARVDEAVSAAIASGASLYVAERGRLAELGPDLVVGQAVCDVCAVGPDEAASALPEGARLLSLRATSLAGLREDLAQLGAATGRAREAEAEIEALEAELETLRGAGRGRRALALEWSDPPFLGGHWIPELFHRVGAEHLLAGPGEPSRRARWSDVRAAAPEVVVFMPCGYDLGGAKAEAEGCAPLLELGAEVWATDATRLFSRCTSAAVRAGAATLAALLSGAGPDPRAAVRVR